MFVYKIMGEGYTFDNSIYVTDLNYYLIYHSEL